MSAAAIQQRDLIADPLPHHVAGRSYSFLRAVRRAAELGKRVDGLEGEVSAEIESRMNRKAQGFYLPLDAVVPLLTRGERRALNSTTGAGMIPANFAHGELIGALRARSLVAQLGARMPMIAPGRLQIPRVATGATVEWLADGAAPSGATTPTIDQVAIVPRTLGGHVDMTRTMAKSGGAAAEAILVDDLAGAIAAELDRVGLNGSGIDPEPGGALANEDVTTLPIDTNGGALTRAHLVELERIVGNANGDAGPGASLAFVTTPNARAKLRLTPRAAGSDRFIWDDDNLVCGHPAYATRNMPSDLAKGSGSGLSALLFGDWTALTIPVIGAVDVIVNPFAFSALGIIRVSSFLEADAAVRNEASFAKVVDVVTS